LTKPVVIVLNGVGSAGKSSTAKALQHIAREPLLHVSMDAFLEMLPARMFGHPDGYIFETTIDDEGKPTVVIHSGPVLARLMSGMRAAVAAMAEQGNNIVVDDVMFGGDEAEEYRRLLAAFDVHLVGLFAPLEVLEQREIARGDRDLGLARWQYDRVHQGVRYDLEIDTSRLTPAEAAETIRAAFGL
jgi:chloramphenicol 3-O phosphotransferase